VNILLVDDRPANLTSFKALLVNKDYTIVTATSGEDALKALLQEDFAVIILDVQMQGMDGFETAALIRTREKSKDTPIIFITAYNQTDENILYGYTLGAVDYIFKPVVPEIFKAKVSVFADLFRKQQQLLEQAALIEATNGQLQIQLNQVQRLNVELYTANRAMEQEVTKRLEAENTVKKSEKLYRVLTQYLPRCAVFLFDTDFRFLIVDGNLLNTRTFTRQGVQERLEGKIMRDVLPSELCDWLEPYFREGLGGKSIRFEIPIEQTFYAVHIQPVRDEEDAIFAGLGMVQDITETKQNEQILSEARDLLETKVQERATALERQNHKLAILNAAGQVLIATLETKQILEHTLTIAANLAQAENGAAWLWNEAQQRLVCRAVLVAQDMRWVGYSIRPTDGLLGTVMQTMQTALITGIGATTDPALTLYTAFEKASRLTLPLHSPNGVIGVIDLLSNTASGFTKDDQILVETLVATASVALDNARLFAAEAFARREAEDANALKLKFLAMISHELRTPLTSIKGFATTLLATDVEWDIESQQNFIHIISEEADKLTDLIEQLLDLSRLQAGTLRIQTESCTLDAIFGTALAQLEALTIEHNLVFDIAADLPMILADKQRVASILVNLVGNAARYSPLHTRIMIAAQKLETGEIQIAVSDEGPGIPCEDREKIFEAFWQTEDRNGKPTKGVGLGLAICKGLVNAHGGKIWVADTPAGTTMCFTLLSTAS
jgi:signal transduction histidine kinase/DNA-binding response OmpR family regulator